MATGGSYPYLKTEIVTFLKTRLPLGAHILDVGAGGGTYGYYFGVGYNIDAVEVWPESVEVLNNSVWYSKIYQSDIRDFNYQEEYDLIIFGDILEHLTVEDAQKVLKEAEKHAKHIMIAVPYLYEQDALYDNEAEIHLQPDLTPEIFNQRYHGYEFIMGKFNLYGYYYK